MPDNTLAKKAAALALTKHLVGRWGIDTSDPASNFAKFTASAMEVAEAFGELLAVCKALVALHAKTTRGFPVTAVEELAVMDAAEAIIAKIESSPETR
jgi:hypothetical protein